MEMLKVEANTVSFNAALSVCEVASGWKLSGVLLGLWVGFRVQGLEFGA